MFPLPLVPDKIVIPPSLLVSDITRLLALDQDEFGLAVPIPTLPDASIRMVSIKLEPVFVVLKIKSVA